MSMQMGSPKPESRVRSTGQLRALCYLVPGRAWPGRGTYFVLCVPRELPGAPGNISSKEKPGHKAERGDLPVPDLASPGESVGPSGELWTLSCVSLFP